MKNSREEILGRVRAALTPLAQRAAYPEFAADVAVMRQLFADGRDLWLVFVERLTAVNGIALENADALVGWLRQRGHLHGYCDPALWTKLAPHFDASFNVETTFDRTRVDDYAFGITRAAGASDSDLSKLELRRLPGSGRGHAHRRPTGRLHGGV